MSRHRLLVAYDIGEDGDRVSVAARLAALGHRIQESVFLLECDDDEQRELLATVERRIDLEHDKVHTFVLCADCLARAGVLGQADLTPPPICWTV